MEERLDIVLAINYPMVSDMSMFKIFDRSMKYVTSKDFTTEQDALAFAKKMCGVGASVVNCDAQRRRDAEDDAKFWDSMARYTNRNY